MPNMGVGDLLLSLWVLSAAVQTSHASLSLSVSTNVTAACGQNVTLRCNISAHHGTLSVKHLSWTHDKAVLCKVEGGNLTNSEPTRVHCDYTDKSLSVTFLQRGPQKNRPLSDEYLCKLRSNQAAPRTSTWVHLKECTERIPTATTEGPSCTFTRFFSDGEVHWYQNQTRLPQRDVKTRESVGEDCCVTLNSSLHVKNPSGTYSCSLWNNETKNCTASKLVPFHQERLISPTVPSGNLGLWGSVGSVVIVSVLLMSL